MLTENVFNTRRLYAKEGQVIAYRIDREQNVTYFEDFSRGIRGTIPYAIEVTETDYFGDTRELTPREVNAVVLAEYDAYNYDGPTAPREVQIELAEMAREFIEGAGS